MKNSCLLILFLCVGMFISCNNRTQMYSEENVPIINVDLDNKQEFKLSLLADSINYIKLETPDDGIISRVKKIIADEDYNLYILDNHSKIFVFDRYGNYKYSINSVGSGPEEYQSIGDFSLHQENKHLEIWDIDLRRILHFDLRNGEFLRSYSIEEEEFTYSLFPIENNQYLSYLPLKVSSTGRYGVNLLDSNYNRVETLLEYSTEYPLAGQYFGFISQIGANKYSIFSQVENMVYHLESGHLQSAYKVDVKGKKDMSELEGKTSLGLTDYEMEMIPYVFHYKENSRFILFVFLDNGKATLVIHDKHKECTIAVKDFDDRTHPFMLPIMTDTPNVLFGAFYLEQFMHVDLVSGNNKDLNPEFLKLLKTSKEEDNPIIQVLYLNH